jgi:hypothetical protein
MFPAEITTNYIISQVVGLVAIIIIIIGYSVNTKKKQLLLSIFANIFISISFLFLGTYVACIGIIISTIRTIIFFIYELKFKQVPTWLISIIFLVLIFNSSILMESLWDLVPMFSLMLFTLGFRIRRLVYMRLFFIIPLIMFFVYDIVIFAYSDALLKIVELVVVGISTTRFFVRKTKLERIKATEELQGEMEEISDD